MQELRQQRKASKDGNPKILLPFGVCGWVGVSRGVRENREALELEAQEQASVSQMKGVGGAAPDY